MENNDTIATPNLVNINDLDDQETLERLRKELEDLHSTVTKDIYLIQTLPEN